MGIAERNLSSPESIWERITLSLFVFVLGTFSSVPAFHEMNLYSEIVGTLEILASGYRARRHTAGFLGHKFVEIQ